MVLRHAHAGGKPSGCTSEKAEGMPNIYIVVSAGENSKLLSWHRRAEQGGEAGSPAYAILSPPAGPAHDAGRGPG